MFDADLDVLSTYLARRDIPTLAAAPVSDFVILLGSGLLEPLEVAVDAMQSGVARRLLISGGLGHSSRHLWDAVAGRKEYASIEVEGRPEAAILFDIATRIHGLPRGQVLVEDRSTNCGANAVDSRWTIEAAGFDLHRAILIQDPTMQRRSHASFERAWSGTAAEFLSFAPFVPNPTDPLPWPFERFVSLVLGEIPRLRDDEHGYGPRGQNFIDHIDIPGRVLEAFARASKRFAPLAGR